MMSVPCPVCGGLVTEEPRCKKCGTTWGSVTEFIYDGLCATSEQAYKICGSREWETMADAQPTFDMLALNERYYKELEKHGKTR